MARLHGANDMPDAALFALEQGRFVNAIARMFVQGIDERRAYLMSANWEQRVDIVEESLLQLMMESAQDEGHT